MCALVFVSLGHTQHFLVKSLFKILFSVKQRDFVQALSFFLKPEKIRKIHLFYTAETFHRYTKYNNEECRVLSDNYKLFVKIAQVWSFFFYEFPCIRIEY